MTVYDVPDTNRVGPETRISDHETGWGTSRLGDMALKLTGVSLRLA